MKAMAILLAAASALCGCATVQFCDRGGKNMVDITNTGWYLLNIIPLASGDPDAPNENTCRLFRQTTTLANTMKLLDYAMAKSGAERAKCVTSYKTDENVLFILLKRHACHTSAELVPAERRNGETE